MAMQAAEGNFWLFTYVRTFLVGIQEQIGFPTTFRMITLPVISTEGRNLSDHSEIPHIRSE